MTRQLDPACKGPRRVVLRGISGSGKTQLALEYLSRARGGYSAILWISAGSEMSINQSFASRASHICLQYPSFRDQTKHLETRDAVGNWLREPIHRDWLLVIDSIDDLVRNKHLLEYVRGLDLGAICVTSTYPVVSHALNASLIELGPLDSAASQSLLLWRAFGTDEPTEDGKSGLMFYDDLDG